jgi:cytochrome c-type biogenesis protein CcmH/NrfF
LTPRRDPSEPFEPADATPVRGRRWIARAALAVLLLAAFAPAAPVGAETGAPGGERWSPRLFRELMSPFCPGRTIADCPSPQADQLRVWVGIQEAAGRTREDVEAELFERFGDAVLPAPRPEGFGITAYAVPIGATILGGFVLAIFLRRQLRAAASAAPAAVGPLDPEVERAIDEELAGRSPRI